MATMSGFAPVKRCRQSWFTSLPAAIERRPNLETCILLIPSEEGEYLGWEKRRSLNPSRAARYRELARSITDRAEPVIVQDLWATPHPLLEGEEEARFFAGFPIFGCQGRCLGVVLLLDPRPQALGEEELAQIRDWIRMLGSQIELMRQCEQEERYRSLFDHSSDAILVFDRRANLIDANRTTQTMLGWSLEELRGKKYLEAFGGGRTADYLSFLVENGLLGSTNTGELEISHKHGHLVPVTLQVIPIFTGETVTGAYCTLTDMSDQRMLEAQLQDSEERARSLIKYTPDAILMMDRHLNLVSSNPALVAITGYTEAELKQHGCAKLFAPAEAEEAKRRIADALEGQPIGFHSQIYRKDGAPVDVFIRATPIVVREQVQGLYCMLIDLTAVRQLERAVKENEQRFKSLFEHHPAAVFSLDLAGKITAANPSAEGMGGVPRDQLIGRTFKSLVSPSCAEEVEYHFRQSLHGAPLAYECESVSADGKRTLLHVTNVPIVVDGAVVGVYAIVLDVTRAKEIQRQLKESEQLYRYLFDTSADAVLLFDRSGKLVRHNKELERMSGLPSEELLGDGYLRLLPTDKREKGPDWIRRTLNGERLTADVTAYTAQGKQLHCLVNSVPIEVDGEVVGAYVTVKDITQQKQAEMQMTRLAYHDPLTGLPNRAFFLDRLRDAYQRALRVSQVFAVLYLDLDGFKQINDSLGHEAGDTLLVQAANRLSKCVRPSDIVARLGGDEFTILLDGLPSREQAEKVAERVIKELQRPFRVSGSEVFVSTSVGVAYNDQAEGPGQLLRYADIAMYHAKRGGKGKYACFVPLIAEEVSKRLSLEADLRRAIEQKEFRLLYQPVFDLATRKLVGVEALVRWEHPTRGLISLAEFISIAEETGQIMEIGEWVLSEACRQIHQWHVDYPTAPRLHLMVNLSARQFYDPYLTATIGRVLNAAQVPADLLVVEVAATVMMADFERGREILAELKELGVRTAVDDFGTGPSSLGYIKELPVDTVKIDRSFVQALGRSQSDTALVRAVITFAKDVGLSVCGEGVETEDQLRQLRELGCDQGQGYFFEHPVPPEAIAALLREQAGVERA